MEEKEFLELELLLSKLHRHLKTRYCIVPNAVHEGYHIATYDENGDIVDKCIGVNLSSVCEQLLKLSEISPSRAEYCKINDKWRVCKTWRSEHKCLMKCEYHKI